MPLAPPFLNQSHSQNNVHSHGQSWPRINNKYVYITHEIFSYVVLEYIKYIGIYMYICTSIYLYNWNMYGLNMFFKVYAIIGILFPSILKKIFSKEIKKK